MKTITEVENVTVLTYMMLGNTTLVQTNSDLIKVFPSTEML
jgi:hypothetical protein